MANPKKNTNEAQKKTSEEGPALADVRIDLPFERFATDQYVGNPRCVDVMLNGKRRRKLHAILRGLKASGAVVECESGGQSVNKPVEKFANVFQYLLDAVHLTTPGSASDMAKRE